MNAIYTVSCERFSITFPRRGGADTCYGKPADAAASNDFFWIYDMQVLGIFLNIGIC